MPLGERKAKGMETKKIRVSIVAAICAAATLLSYGGENLIVNGDFESSTGIGASEGTKAVKDGASLAPWKVLRVTNTGLARAVNAPTWMLDSNTRTQCGTFAVYMQNASLSKSSYHI